MNDLIIYWKDHDGYYIKDEYGEHPVSFQLSEVNWNFTGVYGYGGSELIDDYLKFGIELKLRDDVWIIRFDLTGKFYLYNTVNKKDNDRLSIPPNLEFASYFKKTGKHVITGDIITIPINCSFNKQIY